MHTKFDIGDERMKDARVWIDHVRSADNPQVARPGSLFDDALGGPCFPAP